MLTSVVILSAVILDKRWGEPEAFHPLVGFGNIANMLEKKLNHPSQCSPIAQRLLGLLAVLLCVATPILCVAWINQLLAAWSMYAEYALTIILLYSCIGYKSLIEHAKAIAAPLQLNDLDKARDAVSRIVSRDTHTMNKQSITKASIESVLENGADALFSALFWYGLLGLEAAIAYRLINTLDAMWGYKTPRFIHFGYTAAKADDILNYIPARLTALSYALCGNTKNAIHCWQSQAQHCESPNGGPVMTAGAGALEIIIGGPAYYQGQEKEKPIMGVGQPATAADIHRAHQLISRSLILWITVAFAFNFVYSG